MDCEVSGRDLLERVLLDACAEPTDLPLSLLKTITSNFSDGQQIGRGGFATVYKGLLHNGTVAVKRLSQEVDVDEKKFNQEVDSLMKVKHENIVRFLGYCADTQGKVWNVEGKNVMAEVRQRLLCFEYLPKGSLDRYITDASQGLEWNIRYQIMKGICEGLHYLRKENILHLDLKPANILLNDNMVPKIADFGLSRCFDEDQSQAITSKLFGSQGYMAPEFFSKTITFKPDIYSLGVIFLEILTGQKGYTPVENVLESWKIRFKTSNGDKRLKQVRVCAEIGIKCTDFNPANRPDIRCIIENLEEIEHKYGFVEAELCTSSATHEERDAAKEVSQVDPALLRSNVLNDAFHISHDGVFGTINNFRLGRLSNVEVQWDEINAAWGQAALLLRTMAQYFTPKFQYRIKIHPKGSYPRVSDIHNSNTYELFGPVNLFSSTRFDKAMKWFLTCLQELAEFAISLDKENNVPPEKLLKLPYKIDGDKVGSHTIVLSFNKNENWTKALKYMLCNLKWVLYWFIDNTSFGPPSGPVHALVHSLNTNQGVDPTACSADWCLVADADLL